MNGLSTAEATERLARTGPNTLPERLPDPLWRRFLRLSEVLLVAAGAILAYALDLREETGALLLPLTAAQILCINLMTDGLPRSRSRSIARPASCSSRPGRPTLRCWTHHRCGSS